MIVFMVLGSEISTGFKKLILIVIFATIFVAYISTINPEISDFSQDSARYLLLAISIAQGKGYRELEKPEEPPHAEVMPLLPLLIAPIVRLFPNNLIPLKFLISFFAFLSSFVFYLFLFRLGFSQRIILLLVYSFVPFIFLFQTQILSDFPHLVFTILVFFLFEKAFYKKRTEFSHWAKIGVLCAIAFYFRQTALVLFFSGILALGINARFRKKFVILGFCSGFVLPISFWYVRNFLISAKFEPVYGKKFFQVMPGNPFAGELTLLGIMARIIRRSRYYLFTVEKDIMLGSGSDFLLYLWLFFLILMVTGIFYELLKNRSVFAIYFFLYLFLISGFGFLLPRYVLPLLPLSIYFTYVGLEKLMWFSFRSKNFSRGIVLAFFVILFLYSSIRSFQVISFQHKEFLYPQFITEEYKEAISLLGQKNFAFYPDAFQWHKRGGAYFLNKCKEHYNFLLMLEWAKRNLHNGDVVASRKPALFCFLSGRKSVQFPAEVVPERFFEKLGERSVDYVLADEISKEVRKYLIFLKQNYPDRLIEVKRFGDTVLFKLSEG